MNDTFSPLRKVLDRWATAGRQAPFWLRDDDAVVPGGALDRLLDLGRTHGVPLTLAVIPQQSGVALAEDLEGHAVEVAVHGWSHVNHAAPDRKSCELGPERQPEVVLAEVTRGLIHLRQLHGARLIPMLVPPWNRIDPALIPLLKSAGFQVLSVFGPESAVAPLSMINAHVDLMDWRGHRGGRDAAALIDDLVARLDVVAATGGHVGFLTHHLVHDAAAWTFIEQLFDVTATHPGCLWMSSSGLLASMDQSRVT